MVCFALSLLALADAGPPQELAPFFRPPAKFAGDLGAYRSPLLFDDGTPVREAKDWPRRRAEILKHWHAEMGLWPPVIDKPKVELKQGDKCDGFTRHRARVEVAPGTMADDVYLLMPDGKGPFPAVLVVFYDAATGAGLARPEVKADYAYQLARRGFVTLSVGSPPGARAAKGSPTLQPLSYAAYMAANCYQALAHMPEVDPKRVGVVGLSYGGKWAMFAGCLCDKFACGVWSDPGVVFDEKRPNVNYWEPWYLGLEPGGEKRKPGVPSDANPRTGPYKRLVAAGRDLHELHALMAPRPFLVSGGSEDPPERWKALNHAVAVNALLGHRDRVAMTNRPGHVPTDEANGQVYRFFEHVLKPAAPTLARQVAVLRGELERAGQPWPKAVTDGLDAAVSANDEPALRRLLADEVLVAVSINPEGRVKVARGPAAADLVAGRPKLFLVRIDNASGCRQLLKPLSSYAGAPANPFALSIPTFGTLTPELVGHPAEYRLLSVACRAEGRHEVTVAVEAGQGSQDLGFRAEVPVLFAVARPTR